MKRFLAITTIAALLGTGGRAPGQNTLSPDAIRLAADSNVFAVSLYGQLAGADGNLFFSPYSVSSALAMTYAGARGATAEQMSKALNFRLGEEKLHAAFAQLIREQNAPGKKRGYQLAVANALWGQSGFAFQPEFVARLRESYGAGMHELDFMGAPDAARKRINAWVEKATQDKIKDLLREGTIEPDMRLVLTNAIYFKSAWMEPFNEGMTKKENFVVSGAKTVKADMMHRQGTYSFYEDEDLQLIDMPYDRRDLSLIAVLPRRKDGLAQLERNITAPKLDGWLKARKDYDVDVRFPKFKMTVEEDLKKPLSALGMPLAFSDLADFSGISTRQKLQIGFVLHKAFIDLNEKGTEAAAATAVGIRVTSAPITPPNKASFHADHPFLFLIRDNRTGCALFLGRVVNPT